MKGAYTTDALDIRRLIKEQQEQSYAHVFDNKMKRTNSLKDTNYQIPCKEKEIIDKAYIY